MSCRVRQRLRQEQSSAYTPGSVLQYGSPVELHTHEPLLGRRAVRRGRGRHARYLTGSYTPLVSVVVANRYLSTRSAIPRSRIRGGSS
eukprot:161428-Hanusia_phi.AAC.3